MLADNQPVCTVSVVHNQLKDKEEVIHVLTEELELPGRQGAKTGGKGQRPGKRIRTNVPKETGDRIREYNLPGVKVDEDFKRYYPYGSAGLPGPGLYGKR
ncbi:MAG: hypothetical protein ACLR6B_20800 [Blautia sp.]